MGVAAGTRRMDKIAGLTALLLQMRACEGYGRPAQQSARLRGEPMKPYGGYRGFIGGASFLRLTAVLLLHAAGIGVPLHLTPSQGPAADPRDADPTLGPVPHHVPLHFGLFH